MAKRVDNIPLLNLSPGIPKITMKERTPQPSSHSLKETSSTKLRLGDEQSDLPPQMPRAQQRQVQTKFPRELAQRRCHSEY